MHLNEISIRNYRGIKDVSLTLEEICILIGENNSGKSTVIDALMTCLSGDLLYGKKVFDIYDYHLDSKFASPAKAKPIEITLKFRERHKGEWVEETTQKFSNEYQEDKSGLKHIILQVTSQFDEESNDFRTDYEFLDVDGDVVALSDKSQSLMKLQKQVPVFFLSARRDVNTALKPGTEMWDELIRAVEWNEEEMTKMQGQLVDLNERHLMSKDSVKFFLDWLNVMRKIVSMGRDHSFQLEAFPTKGFNIPSMMRMFMSASTGAQIPIENHGFGVQSLTVLHMHAAYMESLLNRGLGPNIEPLLVLEEPEAHLHPAAAIAFGESIRNYPGQKLIVSHSGPFLSEFEFENIVRSLREAGEIKFNRINKEKMLQDLNKTEQKDFGRQTNFNILKLNPGMLLSRGCLFVEGESDATILTSCAAAMGINLAASGIYCMTASQANLGYLIRLADQYGIGWFVFADGDSQGDKDVKNATNLLNGRNPEDHILQHKYKGIEMLACKEGHGGVYVDSIAPQNRHLITLDESAGDEYYEQVLANQIEKYKTRVAPNLCQAIMEGGAQAVPPTLKQAVRKVLTLAEGVA